MGTADDEKEALIVNAYGRWVDGHELNLVHASAVRKRAVTRTLSISTNH